MSLQSLLSGQQPFAGAQPGLLGSSNLFALQQQHQAAMQQGLPQEVRPMEFGEPLICEEEALGGRAEAAVIWLHGLADKPAIWGKAFAKVRRDSPGRWKWIFLRGPKIIQPHKQGEKVTGFGQFLTTDCMHIGSTDHENPDATYYSSAVLGVHLIQQNLIREGIPANKILIGGFSQGGAVAMEAALKFPTAFAGCVSLSGWLTVQARILLSQPGSCRNVPPFLLCHGTQDECVGLDCADSAKVQLGAAGASVKMETFLGLSHTSNASEIKVVGDFVIEKLSGKSYAESSSLGAEARKAAARNAAAEVANAMAARMNREFQDTARSMGAEVSDSSGKDSFLRDRMAALRSAPADLGEDSKVPLLFKRSLASGPNGLLGDRANAAPSAASSMSLSDLFGQAQKRNRTS